MTKSLVLFEGLVPGSGTREPEEEEKEATRAQDP
jgi:hypothetical protein